MNTWQTRNGYSGMGWIQKTSLVLLIGLVPLLQANTAQSLTNDSQELFANGTSFDNHLSLNISRGDNARSYNNFVPGVGLLSTIMAGASIGVGACQLFNDGKDRLEWAAGGALANIILGRMTANNYNLHDSRFSIGPSTFESSGRRTFGLGVHFQSSQDPLQVELGINPVSSRQMRSGPHLWLKAGFTF